MKMKDYLNFLKASGMEIQSMIFSKENGDWTLDKAKTWLEEHDYRSDKIDETDQSWRFRQFDPSLCDEDTYATLTENFPEGVSAVACKKKDGKCAHDLFRDGRTKHFAGGEIKALGEKAYQHIISGSARDRAGDIIEVEGWDFSEFMKNPVVLWSHDAWALPIGASQKVWIEGQYVHAVTKFADYDFANRVEKLYADKTLRAWSVRFLPITYESFRENNQDGYRFKTQKLLEYSCVNIPCFQDALGYERIYADMKFCTGCRKDKHALSPQEKNHIHAYLKQMTESLDAINALLRSAKIDEEGKKLKRTYDELFNELSSGDADDVTAMKLVSEAQKSLANILNTRRK